MLQLEKIKNPGLDDKSNLIAIILVLPITTLLLKGFYMIYTVEEWAFNYFSGRDKNF